MQPLCVCFNPSGEFRVHLILSNHMDIKRRILHEHCLLVLLCLFAYRIVWTQKQMDLN